MNTFLFMRRNLTKASSCSGLRLAPMVKVASADPSSSTGICLVSALSWVNNCFFLVGAAPLGSGVPASAGCADAAVLKASLSARSASPVSLGTVRTPLLPGIFIRLYAG